MGLRPVKIRPTAWYAAIASTGHRSREPAAAKPNPMAPATRRSRIAATASTRRWVWAVATDACAPAVTGVGPEDGAGVAGAGSRRARHPRSGAPLRGGGPRGQDRRQSRSRTTVRTRGGRCRQATGTDHPPRVPAGGKPTTSSGRKSLSGKRRAVHVRGAASFQAWSPRPSAPDFVQVQQSQG